MTIFVDNLWWQQRQSHDLWHLRHWLQFWQLRTWIHDNLCYLTINCDTGQHSQFLRCFISFFAFRKEKIGTAAFWNLSWLFSSRHVSGEVYEGFLWNWNQFYLPQSILEQHFKEDLLGQSETEFYFEKLTSLNWYIGNGVRDKQIEMPVFLHRTKMTRCTTR